MKKTCWCDWLWFLVSTAHLFARTLLGFCHRERIYAPFLYADFNLTNASFLRKTKSLLLASLLHSDHQSEKTLTPRTYMTGTSQETGFYVSERDFYFRKTKLNI